MKREGLNMPKFCPNCATALDADARFCPSCRTSVGVASALASEITGSLRAGVRSVVLEAGRSVPPFVWAGALQVYWLLTGIWLMLLGAGILLTAAGILGAASQLSSGLAGGGPQLERVVLASVLAFLGGAVDTCLSTVLVYGFLTLRKWVYGVFMVWLPVKVILTIFAYLAIPSFERQQSSTPFVIIFVIALLVIIHVAALVVEFMLVKRGTSALAAA